MEKKLLLDGCSFTYGLGLKKEETLEHHFIENGYQVLNLSRPGKSNHAIALDVYNHIDKVDVVVVGWTFSSRWHLKYHGDNIDLLATRLQIELPYTIDSGAIEQSYQDLHRSLYSLFDSTHWDQTSDMLVDTTHALAQQKSTVFFSWEPRDTQCSLYYPHIPVSLRLPCGHLNADGTTYLFDNLTAKLTQ